MKKMKKMKNNKTITSFHQLELYKERLKGEIARKELEIQYNYGDLTESMTPPNVKNAFVELLMNRPDIPIKIGWTLFSLIRKRRSRKKR